MEALNNLQTLEGEKRVVDPARIQASLNNDLPDGYKLKNANNNFPKFSFRDKRRTLA